MHNLELAWDTYDFYTTKAIELENNHEDVIIHYNHFIENNLNPSQIKKNWLRNKINKSFNKVLNIHVKQIGAISDLLEAYNYYRMNGITIPLERRIDPQTLVELKNITATLLEKEKQERRQINEVLR